MSDWIPYEGSGEKPAWIPDDCRAVRQYADGFVGEPSLAGGMNWNLRIPKRGGIVAFKIVDDRYQHLGPPQTATSGALPSLNFDPGLKPLIASNWFAIAQSEPPKELPVWPTEKWKVCRGSTDLGVVDLDVKPNYSMSAKRNDACLALGMHLGDYVGDIFLRRVSPSTNRRRGKLVRMEGRG